MKQRNIKHEKRLKKLVLTCLLLAVVLTVGTYAWFIGMQTVSVEAFEVKIAAVDNLALSIDGVTWESALTINETKLAENTYAKTTYSWTDLKPVSTIGEISPTTNKLVMYDKGSLTATPVGYRLMASRVENNKDVVPGGTEYLEDDGYVAFDLFVMNLSGDAYYSEITDPSNEEAVYLTYASKVTTEETGATASGIENSVRVGFAQIARVSATKYGQTDDAELIKVITGMTCEDENSDVTSICRKAQIWEPNENDHVAGAVTWYEKTCKARKEAENAFEVDSSAACEDLDEYITTNAVAGEILASDYVDVYDGAYNTYEGTADTLLQQVDTFTDTEKMQTGTDRIEFMTFAPNSITKVRVYIWIEGQDIDNYDFASLGEKIKVEFGFTKERITTGEINEDIVPDEDLNAEVIPGA